jgi:AcrR family transcriptional regulator
MATSARRLAPEARRGQLVEVAFDLFARGSYETVSLDDVAARADVRRGLLYRYFPAGKPDLYLAVVERAWARLVELVDTSPGRELEVKLPANVRLFLDLADRADPALLVVAQATRVNEPKLRAVSRAARRQWAMRIAQNHLGLTRPPERVIAALTGYLAMGELLIEEWKLHGSLARRDVEAVLEKSLPAIVAAARR